MDLFEFMGKTIFDDTPKLFGNIVDTCLDTVTNIPDAIDDTLDNVSDCIDKILGG